MEIRLTRGPHPSALARACALGPLDPYLEWCWTPIVGPTSVALVRRCAALLDDGCDAVRGSELARLLGLQASEVPTRSNPLGRAIRRAHQFGLVCEDRRGGPVVSKVGIYEQIPLLTQGQLERLPAVAWKYHRVTVERLARALARAAEDRSSTSTRRPPSARAVKGPLPSPQPPSAQSGLAALDLSL